MDQFCSDSYSNFSFPNQIHIDLCETEEEYILETDVQNVTEQNVLIKKLETGLAICILHKTFPYNEQSLYLLLSFIKDASLLRKRIFSHSYFQNEVADKHEKFFFQIKS